MGDDAAVRGSPSLLFAGEDAAVRGSPRPAVRGRSRRRPASDSMPAGPPLTQACRIAADSWPPLTLVPWIRSTSRPGVPCHVPRVMVFKSCLALRNSFNVSCLVHGDSSGAGGSSCSGRGGHFQPPAPLSWKWKRLLRDPVRAPDVMSCPEEASASELSPGGLPVPVGCPVPVLFLSCLVCLAPEGSDTPRNYPREIFLGGRRVPAGGAGPRGLRPRPRRPSAMASRTPSPAMASDLSVPLCLFHSQSAHPPSPVELLRRGTRLSGGGSYVSPLSCVSCVPASCVHIWFVSCPCFM